MNDSYSGFDSPLGENAHEAKSLLLSIHKKIRRLLPKINTEFDPKRVSISEIKEGFLNGESIKRVIVILRNSGCEWALREDGGCFMCGHLLGTSRGFKVTADDLIRQFEQEISMYDFSMYPMLCLYNSGSFLNSNEIDLKARLEIFKQIAKIGGLKRLIIESRPEFITEHVLDEIEGLLPNIEVEIGVGLETADDNKRDLFLNKGIQRKVFLDLAQKFKGRKTYLLAYVLLKPPFLTEAEAVIDACRTIEFAFSSGVDIISLEPVSVQSFTLTDFLHEAGYYRPPWIWSAMKVIKQTHSLGLIRIGGFEFFPIPKIFSHNCLACNERMIDAIQKYNMTRSIDHFNNLICQCQQEWQYDMKEEEIDLSTRIANTIQSIDINKTLDKMVSNYTNYGEEMLLGKDIVFRVCSTPNT